MGMENVKPVRTRLPLSDGREIVADVTGVTERPEGSEVQMELRATLVSERKLESTDTAKY